MIIKQQDNFIKQQTNVLKPIFWVASVQCPSMPVLTFAASASWLQLGSIVTLEQLASHQWAADKQDMGPLFWVLRSFTVCFLTDSLNCPCNALLCPQLLLTFSVLRSPASMPHIRSVSLSFPQPHTPYLPTHTIQVLSCSASWTLLLSLHPHCAVIVLISRAAQETEMLHIPSNAQDIWTVI